ncbi:peroxiredoxin family protein [Sphingobacterium sp. SGL-16]|uniref:Redoxin domain-containing protein n=2 Tax=Sphingobacteriaceae TaxID=84566 RepID=A0ABR7YE84_9SPHI|nr:redoxin domain-containing protein [Sphingobacterium litopenaei]NGM73009.1 peroxiredoxin family protein [Sphingobacterium sp. SGL-16]
MKKMMISTLILSTILGFSSCSNSTNNTNTATEVENHEGHDHSGHDHSTHSPEATTAEAQQQTVEELSQKAPAPVLPEFTFYKVKSGISYTQQDIPKGKKSAFILFDPSCGHCQLEAGQIAKNYAKLKNINIYFVSMNDPALMANFLETFGKELVGKPNVEVLYDKNQDFIQKIHVPKQFPANYVYTAEGKLQSYWDGDRKIEEIIKEYTK